MSNDSETMGRSDQLFPKEISAKILGELSAWTSVSDITVAARILESRTVPGDQPEGLLLMPLEHNEPAFEQIFLILLGYLMAGYAVPSQKIVVCCALDPQITEATVTELHSLHFKPTVKVGKIPGMNDKQIVLIQDQPAEIELIRAPLNCLMDIYLDKYEFTNRLCNIVAKHEGKTEGRPTIFHRPYADACLPSFIEAACFFSLGLDVGTRFASPGEKNIDRAYRAVNVQMVPPLDLDMLRIAKQDGQRMLDELR